MEPKKKKLSPMLVIFITVFIDLLGFGIVLPLSPYYTEHFGGTALSVGLLSATYSCMQFIFAPVWGRLSDKVGRRPIILMSILGGAVSFILFAAANSLAMLFVTRTLQGIFGANISATQAYVADVTTKENRSKSMGIIGAAFGLGFVFGPFIGAKLIEYGPAVGHFFGYGSEGVFGMGFPGLVSGFMCLCNFVLAYFILPESLKPENRGVKKEKTSRFSGIFKAFQNPKTNWLMWIFFLATFAMTNMEVTLALLTERRLGFGVRQTGELFGFIGVIIAFTQGFLIRKLLPRWGERKILVIGPIVAGCALLLAAGAGTLPLIMLSMALLAVGSGLSNPAILGGVSQLTDPSEQGEVMGVTQSLGSLARMMGPIIGGFLFSRVGPGVPYVLAGSVMLISAIIAIRNISKVPDHGKVDPGAIVAH